MEKFGELLKYYRKKNKLSQQELADNLSHGLNLESPWTNNYISMLESSLGTPPRLEVCEHIISILKLNDHESYEIKKMAFLERITKNKNIDFFDNLKFGHQQELNNQSQFSSEMNTNLNGIQFKCVYLIEWETYDKQELMTDKLNFYLETTIRENIEQKYSYKLLKIEITSNQISLIIETEPNFNLHEFITGLKDFTSRDLKLNFKDQILSEKPVWDMQYKVQTICDVNLLKKEFSHTQILYKD